MGVVIRTSVLKGAWELVSGPPYLGVHGSCYLDLRAYGCMGVVVRISVLRGAWELVSGPPCLGVHGSWYQDLHACPWLGFQ